MQRSQGHGVAGSGLPGPWEGTILTSPEGTWGWAGPQICGLKGQLTRWGRGRPSVRPIPQTPSAVGRGSRHPPRLPVPVPQEGLPRRGQGREAFPGWPWALTAASPPLQPHVLAALLLRAAPQAGRPGLGPRGSWGESVPPTPRQAPSRTAEPGPGLFPTRVKVLCPGAEPRFPPCRWGQVSVAVSLVIPALGHGEFSFPAGGPWAAEDPAVPLPWARRAQSRQVPPCWSHPSSGREAAEAMERFPVFFFSPLGTTSSFESELACLGSAALAKPRACVRGSGWLRGRCWLVSKGFLSPKSSLITGVEVVPAKHQGGQRQRLQHPFLLASLLPIPIPSIPIRSAFLRAKTNSGEKQIDGGDVSERGCFCWREGGSEAFQPCRGTSLSLGCAERDNNNIHNKSRTLMRLAPGAWEGLSRQRLQNGF